MKTALSIAGSDCSGGAGIQADIKTMTMHGVYAMSVITALTAQNTTGVRGIQESTPEFLKLQLDTVFQDIYPDAVKIGMVASGDLIHVIADRLRFYHAGNVVVDPVTEACILPRIVKKDIMPLDEADTKLFLEAIKGDPFELLFTVTLFTGLRKGEVLGLTWNCVDFLRGTILVEKQLQQEKKKKGKYYLATLKNDKPRSVTPAPWVMQILRKQKLKQAEDRIAAGSAWSNPDNLVFTNPLGGHLVPWTVSRHYKEIVASIGRPDARFHDLRHSYAVAAIRSGDDIKTVQGNLGHATASFTLDVYGHVTDQMKNASAARMEAYIKDILSA